MMILTLQGRREKAAGHWPESIQFRVDAQAPRINDHAQLIAATPVRPPPTPSSSPAAASPARAHRPRASPPTPTETAPSAPSPAPAPAPRSSPPPRADRATIAKGPRNARQSPPYLQPVPKSSPAATAPRSPLNSETAKLWATPLSTATIPFPSGLSVIPPNSPALAST